MKRLIPTSTSLQSEVCFSMPHMNLCLLCVVPLLTERAKAAIRSVSPALGPSKKRKSVRLESIAHESASADPDVTERPVKRARKSVVVEQVNAEERTSPAREASSSFLDRLTGERETIMQVLMTATSNDLDQLIQEVKENGGGTLISPTTRSAIHHVLAMKKIERAMINWGISQLEAVERAFEEASMLSELD